ncbi:efflux RND transporter periplasmic adaptor subunit [Wenzhouxiangella sp. EGI_FJ10305]|uniref:efflux RND transporter periplasmic adaptor subunit n=1 Tax=Wenzhouxiangella sp. EGI_FJ10305 TaxID=3243768 RepID=UPI0035D8759C
MNLSNEPAPDDMAEEVRSAIRSDQRRGRLGKLLWILAGGVFLVLITWWLWPREEPIEWQVELVDRGDMVLTATATGNLEPRREITVGAEISGLIRQVNVGENDTVAVGDVLARFDTEELEVSLAQAQARLALARASVAEAEATLEESRANERRLANLVERSVASRAELDAASAAVKRAAARIDSTEASVREAEASVSATRTRLDKAVITSPINGVVLKRDVEPGNTVAASFQAPELFVLAEDLREMELHVSVDEADVGLIKAGQPASFTVDAWPGREFEAHVLRVFLFPNIESNVVTYTTVLDVDNSDESLLPGMTATATITTGTREDIIRIPNAALRFQPPADQVGGGMLAGPPGMTRGGSGSGGSAIWLLRNGEPARVPVRTGHTDGLYTEVLGQSVSAGDRIVVGLVRPDS